MAVIHAVRPRVLTLLAAVVVAQAVGNLGFVLGDRLTIAMPALLVSILLLAEAIRMANGVTGPRGSGAAAGRGATGSVAKITPLRPLVATAASHCGPGGAGPQTFTPPAALCDEVRPAS